MNSYTKKRSSNFTPKEVKTLLALVRKYRAYVECRKIDNRSNQLKHAAWDKITREFNGLLSDGIYRSVHTLRLKYENAKKQSNRKFALLSQMSKNGVDRRSIGTLNITDIDKDIKRLTCKVPSSAVKIEIVSDNEEAEVNTVEEESAPMTPILDDSILENKDIIELSEDSKFIIMNDVGESTVLDGTEMTALVNDCSSSAEVLEAAKTSTIENEPSGTTLENLDSLVLTTEDLHDVKRKCLLEEHNLKLKHLEELHKVMIQHQQLHNKLMIMQTEEIHKEKLRMMKEEHANKMKILDFQRIASL